MTRHHRRPALMSHSEGLLVVQLWRGGKEVLPLSLSPSRFLSLPLSSVTAPGKPLSVSVGLCMCALTETTISLFVCLFP